MAKTIVGLFDNYGEAQRAVVELVESGVAREDIGITSRDYTSYEGESRREESFRDDEGFGRSEEHTSELQSRQYLVCRLLLEKKNTHNRITVSADAYLMLKRVY